MLSKAGRSSEALSLHETCAAANPTSQAAQVRLGSALGTAGRLAEAELMLRRAVSVGAAAPDANAMAKHALSLAKLKRMDEARHGLQLLQSLWRIPVAAVS